MATPCGRRRGQGRDARRVAEGEMEKARTGVPRGDGEHALTLEFPTYIQTTPSDRNRGGTREYPELAKAMESAPPVLTVVEK